MDFDAALGFIRIEIDKELRGRLPVPPGYLHSQVTVRSAISGLLDNDMAGRLVRHLETVYGTSQEDGHSLKSNFTEWYPQRMGEIDSYFWKRLQKYWLDHSVLPVKVVGSIDKVTNEILGYLGDPQSEDTWRRRGLVLGHVQSGKTTNYSALIAKAADAGYRIIIVLAGLTKSLRYQTQIRLDQTFVGKSSLGDAIISEIYPVSRVFAGLPGEPVKIRHPFCGTTQGADFNVNIARGVGATEGNFADPILFVTKKNEKVLESLADWLGDLRQGSPLEGPMLLIDDEADNASINTAKDPTKTTRINQRIRTLLRTSRRTSYVGYTATPFANIFIDPDTIEEMLQEDLFPSHFIKSLDPPDNYIGAEALFSDGGQLADICVRTIPDDHVDLLPLNHKASWTIPELPESLRDAMLEYLLFRAIRTLDGETDVHSAMLVNVSRFNAVQQQVHDELYRLLQSAREAIDVWGASPSWERSALLVEMHEVWKKEYSDCSNYDWDSIRPILKRAVAPIECRLVNMRGQGLDYTKATESGLHVIAVGGLALARGLTLEGLAISYVLRNVGAADTLLQMGRWFGYRPGYAHLCRIHATAEMQQDFREISSAVEELRDDLVRMERMGRSPDEFGLKVRQSPTGIAITAANKMRTAKTLTMAVDLSTRHLQAFELFNDDSTNKRHMAAVEQMVNLLQSGNEGTRLDHESAFIWSGVPVTHVQELLRQFRLPQLEFALGNEDGNLVLDYISDRAKGELAQWDIAFPFKRSGESLPYPMFENPDGGIFCRQRLSGVPRQDDSSIVKITQKNVVADAAPNDLMYGEEEKLLRQRVDILLQDLPESDKLSQEKLYLRARRRPLLVVHVFQFGLAADRAGSAKLNFQDNLPVATISLAFPGTDIEPSPRTYAITIRLAEMIKRQEEVIDSDDEADDEP